MPPSRLREPDDEIPNTTLVERHFYLVMPAALVAWTTSKRWSVVVGVALGATFTPLAIAILQGAIGILSYRLYYRDAPIPLAPSHGVVLVRPDEAGDDDASTEQNNASPSKQRPSALLTPQLLPYGGACSIQPNKFLTQAAQEPPIRLLVIGDSLAIGVGQAEQSTPIMPEVIAKTLSKRMGGRVVYWTCHGAPGASAGWIVRELERGVNYLNQSDDEDELESLPGKEELQSTCSETDESSSDESSVAGDVGVRREQGLDVPPTGDSIRSLANGVDNGVSSSNDATMKVWRQRLAQHQKRFDPEFLGPYDIAVVLTGSNDLKSACFPFLLTGEDAEFHRQAKARGGGYSQELHRLIETLNSKMQVRLQNLRGSLVAAQDSVRERVQDTIVRIAPLTGSRIAGRRSKRGPATSDKSSHEELLHPDEHDDHAERRHFPLVVLPGMTSRALPSFQMYPLRWFVVPTVDIMDKHKRDLAESHPGQVLFVPPMRLNEISEYENQTGEYWNQRCNEDTVLNVRTIKSRDRNRIEKQMGKYFEGNRSSSEARRWFPSCLLPTIPGRKIFSSDGTHPNDQGYDFWGRYIGNAIYDEWHKKNM